MNRSDRIKLSFIRNWNFPGKERLSHRMKPSKELKTTLRDGIIWLNREEIAIYTTADNYIEHTILSTGTYEDEIGKLINISLKPGFVALDIGANIGLQSIRMSKCVGDSGFVYAFEPLNYLQTKFKRNISLNNCANITLMPIALSDREEKLNLKIHENEWNQGTFSLAHTGQGNSHQEVSVKTGDQLSEIQNLSRIDLIKIDVEGFEYHVLKGLSATIHKHQPRIIFEYDENYWTRTGQSIVDCYNFLKALNYNLYQVSALSCELIFMPTAIIGGNLFCLPVNQVPS